MDKNAILSEKTLKNDVYIRTVLCFLKIDDESIKKIQHKSLAFTNVFFVLLFCYYFIDFFILFDVRLKQD